MGSQCCALLASAARPPEVPHKFDDRYYGRILEPMEQRQIKMFIDATPFYRDRDLPACAPMKVRILEETVDGARVTTQLDAGKPAKPGECFTALAEELHFEIESFKP